MNSYSTTKQGMEEKRKWDRTSHSIGKVIRNLNFRNSSNLAYVSKKNETSPLTKCQLKKLNCRNGRSKLQESLVGNMMKSNFPLSRARSDYGHHLRDNNLLK